MTRISKITDDNEIIELTADLVELAFTVIKYYYFND